MTLSTPLLATVALMLLSSSSATFAADLVVLPPEEVPVAPDFLDWNGPYVGVHLGWGFGGDQSFRADCKCGPAYDGDAKVGLDGLLGGVQIGYNYQFSSNWLVGVEGDFSWSGVKGSGSTWMRSASDGVFNTKVDWFGTLRARFGYVADRFMVYGTGGLAYGSLETKYSYAFKGASPTRRDLLSGGVDETSWGWTAGAGAEYALNEHWSLKGEYLYINLGGGGQSMTNSNGQGFSSETDDFKFHTVRLGVNYRF
ncbi:hypothetical protein BFN67_05100 [Pseudaminobacter manganicus]|uniref:Outer membrane protein beta-barrel domain-containing protein n=2 Tax=Manganibacter manganicus TaxID=1873176 RepID=A0A1V8RM12_9HYPH|nr:hypothetical protein BFN67_05100 [Pseudaminobacter manganicus]